MLYCGLFEGYEIKTNFFSEFVGNKTNICIFCINIILAFHKYGHIFGTPIYLNSV